MAVRWEIEFETIDHRQGLVEVYDSTYTGDVISLEPAPNPFSTTISRTGMLDPVMSDSGYLRVISNGLASEAIEEMHPQGGMDRPVEFSIDGDVVWRGFISPETYSVEWESAPVEISFSLVGVLQALEGVNMVDTGVGRQMIAAFLKEILTATGFTWSKILFPPQLIYLNATDYPFNPVTFGEARLSLSRYNFVRVNQNDDRDDPTWTEMVGDSYLTCMTEICRYFGWVAYQYGDTLVLDSPRRDLTSLDEITLAQLDLIIADPTRSISAAQRSRGTIQVNGLDFDGIQHRKSIGNGYRKVTVKTTDNVSSDVYPSLNFKGNPLRTWDQDFVVDGNHLCARVSWLNTERERVKLHAYRMVDGVVTEVPWAVPSQNSDLSLPAGSVVKADSWHPADGPKINYNFTNYIRISANLGNNAHFAADVPMVEISSRQAGCFPAGGALCVSGNFRNSYFWNTGITYPVVESEGLTQDGPFENNLRLSIAIGNKWWSGSAWTDQETILEIPVRQASGSYPWDGSFATGQIVNTKTLTMPYNGAVGHIIPIDTMLEGVVKVKIYPWLTDVPDMQYNMDYAAIYISDLAFRYYSDSENQNEDGISMSLPAGDKFRQEKTVQLAITSSLDNRIGLATLWHGNNPAEKFGYDDIAANFIRPERKLLRTLKEISTLPSTELVLEIDTPSFKPYQTLKYDDKKFMIMGIVTDYAYEHARLTIMSYE